jgi:aminoacrylate hydrolase
MATLDTNGISLHYELHGAPRLPPVLMISGLGGTAASWGGQVARFAEAHRVVAFDQRGTGATTRAKGGYSTEQLTRDCAALLDHLALGPVHVIGASTGGAIGQLLALERPDLVRTLVLASSFARMDAYMRREMALRRKLLAESDARTVFECYALFLFSPRFSDEHPERVAAWIDRCVAANGEREIGLARMDMIVRHDALARLGEIEKPVLAICGACDACTPPHVSEELARGIRGAELAIVPGAGHMLHDEQPAAFEGAVRAFLALH